MAKQILVVDDEPAILPLISACLRKAGFCVWQAHHPLSALHMAANGIPAMDLLLTDFIMPRYHGPALSEKLREYFPYMATLYMGEKNWNEGENRSSDIPDFQWVNKPIQAQALVEKVKAALLAAADTTSLPRLSRFALEPSGLAWPRPGA